MPRWHRGSAQAPFAAVGTVLGPDWSGAGREDKEELNKDTFRLRSRRGIILWITPLILPVASQLLRDINARVCYCHMFTMQYSAEQQIASNWARNFVWTL